MSQQNKVRSFISDNVKTLQNWFRGDLDMTSFSKIEAYYDDDYFQITPDGRYLNRKEVIDIFSQSRDIGLWNFLILDLKEHLANDHVIVTFILAQNLGEKTQNVLNTGILIFDISVKQYQFRYLHQTNTELDQLRN